MATLSNNDIARAIYLASKGKSETGLNEFNKKIVRFLFRKKLLNKSSDILERLEKIIHREEEKIKVKLTSAKKLEEGVRNKIKEFLKKRYKVKEIILEEMLDDRLLGGIRLEANNEVIDLSIKNKINKLQEHLTRKI